MTEETILSAIASNKIFVNEIFSLAINGFIGGKFIDRIAYFMENPKTMRVSARDHFKSTSFYAHFLWTSLKNPHKDIEGHYFSFKQAMAGYHISKIKKLKDENPIFDQCIDVKKGAENVIKYTWDGKHYHTLTPHGLLGFKRGIHCNLIYVDDPFQDPASKLVITIIEKINKILKTEILDMVKKGGQIHIAGTPQTTEDFFFDKKLQKSFSTLILPAIIDEKNKITLWPEWLGWDQLMIKKEERGEKIFNQEYLCSPVYTEEAFFKKDLIMSRVDNDLNILKNYNGNNDVVAGFDIGKKVHPSHLSVFEILEDGSYKMIFHKFLDQWSYTRQVEWLKEKIDQLKIDRLYYDATRGEFESLHEQGLLHENMIPVNFNSKTKNSMATEFEKAVENKMISIINDQRLINQILVVDNDLNAIETPEGHGDAFWSIALAFNDKTEAQPMLTVF